MAFSISILELTNSDVMGGLETLFRWVHVVAVMLWIGVAYFLNWINAPFVASLKPETKRAVLLGLLPRALFFFRFAALYALIFGFLLLFYLYYMSGDYFFRPLTELSGTRPTTGTWIQPLLGLLLGQAIYELLFRTLGKRAPALAMLLWATIAIAFAGFLIEFLETSHRCAYVHVAVLFGTVMAHNTWIIIWPSMRRVINSLNEGNAPDPADLTRTAERGRHSVYMSISVIILMLSVHISWLTGLEAWYLVLPTIFLLGSLAAKLLYQKSTSFDAEFPLS